MEREFANRLDGCGIPSSRRRARTRYRSRKRSTAVAGAEAGEAGSRTRLRRIKTGAIKNPGARTPGPMAAAVHSLAVRPASWVVVVVRCRLHDLAVLNRAELYKSRPSYRRFEQRRQMCR